MAFKFLCQRDHYPLKVWNYVDKTISGELSVNTFIHSPNGAKTFDVALTNLDGHNRPVPVDREQLVQLGHWLINTFGDGVQGGASHE